MVPAHSLILDRKFLDIAELFPVAGHVAFFTLFSEMKDPREFHKVLAL